jgi:hypothetical protein
VASAGNGKGRKLLIGAFVVVVGVLLVAIVNVAIPSAPKEKTGATATTETAATATDETAKPAVTAPTRPTAPPAARPPTGVVPVAADGTCAFTMCGTACINTKESSEHCGACGNACPSPQWCNHGKCVADKCNTKAGEAECYGECKNLLTDPTNCGECKNACAAGQTCKDGSCDPPIVPEGGAGPRAFSFDGGRPPFIDVDGGRLFFPTDGGRPTFVRQ